MSFRWKYSNPQQRPAARERVDIYDDLIGKKRSGHKIMNSQMPRGHLMKAKKTSGWSSLHFILAGWYFSVCLRYFIFFVYSCFFFFVWWNMKWSFSWNLYWIIPMFEFAWEKEKSLLLHSTSGTTIFQIDFFPASFHRSFSHFLPSSSFFHMRI